MSDLKKNKKLIFEETFSNFFLKTKTIWNNACYSLQNNHLWICVAEFNSKKKTELYKLRGS